MTDDKLREGEPEYGNAGQGVQELSPGRPAQASSFAEAMEDTSARPSSFEHVPIVTRGCDPAAAGRVIGAEALRKPWVNAGNAGNAGSAANRQPRTIMWRLGSRAHSNRSLRRN